MVACASATVPRVAGVELGEAGASLGATFKFATYDWSWSYRSSRYASEATRSGRCAPLLARAFVAAKAGAALLQRLQAAAVHEPNNPTKVMMV